jgi:hypothetical protein
MLGILLAKTGPALTPAKMQRVDVALSRVDARGVWVATATGAFLTAAGREGSFFHGGEFPVVGKDGKVEFLPDGVKVRVWAWEWADGSLRVLTVTELLSANRAAGVVDVRRSRALQSRKAGETVHLSIANHAADVRVRPVRP